MRPFYLLMAGVLVLLGSGASALGWFSSSSDAPPGTIAEESITITVTDPSVISFLPVTGAQIGMLIGVALMLIGIGLYIVSRRKLNIKELSKV